MLSRSTKLLRLLTLALISVFVSEVTSSPTAAPVAAQTGECELYTGKTAQPTTVVVGQEVEVTLNLDGRCPGTEPRDTDVVLAIDRSSSMLEMGRWPATIAAATAFLDQVAFGPVRVGIVTFSGNRPLTAEPEAQVDVPLSEDGTVVRNGLMLLPDPPQFNLWTNLSAGIVEARLELTGARGRPDAQKVLILLTDGNHNALIGPAPESVATDAKTAGITIVTVGLGVDATTASRLTAIASAPDLYYEAPSASDLEDVYQRIALSIEGAVLVDLVVTDLLPEDVDYVPGSSVPPPDEVETKRLVWHIPNLSFSGWTARYRVRARVPGTYSTNKLAYVEYADRSGTPQVRNFPNPYITVREPERLAVFMPIALQHYCKPARPFDVALVLDTSSSMWGEKFDRARAGARDFVRLLNMPPTQAAVIAFNDQAITVRGLTSDRDALYVAIDRLPRGEGTRIDRALEKASEELTGANTRPGNAPVIVLLTDGRQADGDNAAVLTAASRARTAGITIFAIGIGPDVSRDLLVSMAGSAERYFPAAGPEELTAIYAAIAGELPCATGAG